MSAFNDKKILVLGLGDSGWSCVRWLKNRGAQVCVADTRPEPPHALRLRKEYPDVQLTLGSFQAQSFQNIDLLVVSPGVPLTEPLVAQTLARGVPVAGDVELFAQALVQAKARFRLLAITGSNGKSTVTSMVGAMCKAAGLNTIVAGNIGLPVLDALSEVERAHQVPDVYVLELSSFQLETTSTLNSTAAAVLNVTEDHLDRYRGMREYALAKARIFQGTGIQVLNRQDRHSMAMKLPGRRIMTFGKDNAVGDSDFGLAVHAGVQWLVRDGHKLLPASELQVTGLHNAENALAALALCSAIDLPETEQLRALKGFKGLAHRMEKVLDVGGVGFYDDSKGTNVGATVAALNGMDRKVVLIAGGDGKGQDFKPLEEPVMNHAQAVVLIGRDGSRIGQALARTSIPLIYAQSMEQAVNHAFDQARPGDAVLLSPACASFDMFQNYVHRAQVFIRAVHLLAQKRNGHKQSCKVP